MPDRNPRADHYYRLGRMTAISWKAADLDLSHNAGQVDLYAGQVALGVAIGGIIACALRNPRWAQWYLADDESGNTPDACRESDLAIMEWCPVRAVEGEAEDLREAAAD